MNAVYTFSYKIKEKTRVKEISASSYHNAIDKACLILEDLNDDLDLIGLDNWEDIQNECSNYNIFVSNLKELDV